MSETNNSTFHIKVVIAVIVIIPCILLWLPAIEGMYSTYLLWRNQPISEMKIGQLILIFIVHGYWTSRA